MTTWTLTMEYAVTPADDYRAELDHMLTRFRGRGHDVDSPQLDGFTITVTSRGDSNPPMAIQQWALSFPPEQCPWRITLRR